MCVSVCALNRFGVSSPKQETIAVQPFFLDALPEKTLLLPSQNKYAANMICFGKCLTVIKIWQPKKRQCQNNQLPKLERDLLCQPPKESWKGKVANVLSIPFYCGGNRLEHLEMIGIWIIHTLTSDHVAESLVYQSGQIIIFHQPRFHWNKGISLTKPPFGVRSCEVAIIWPDQCINGFSWWKVSINIQFGQVMICYAAGVAN